ncbi:MAG: substrate-binding periplasmic protein [Solirubrobacterales bacterium]
MESQPTQPPTVEPGALTLCCSSLDVPPLFETAPDGTRSGYEPAAAEAVAAGAGLELRWLFRPWADFEPALMRGECDAIWCGCAITPERRERMAFTVPYAAFNESVVVRPDDPASSPADLRGRRVLAIAGSTNFALAESFEGAEAVPFDADTDDVLGDMLALLGGGEVEAVVDDDVCFVEPDPAIRVAFTVPTANPWGAACRPGDRELVAALDRAIAGADLRSAWERWIPQLPFPL